MNATPMSGAWTMSMACMPMPAETWTHAAASFLAMWIVMMAAMMLPSLTPMLWRYREAVAGVGGTRLAALTALVAAAYFFVWTMFGLAVLPLDVARTAIEMEHAVPARAVPFVIGAVTLIAGAFQFTAWKARQLACCRDAASRGPASPSAAAAWRHGVRLGLHCVRCCLNLTTILLVVGIMDVRAMAVVTAAITAERLAPRGEPVARAVGGIVVVAGMVLIARAAGLG